MKGFDRALQGLRKGLKDLVSFKRLSGRNKIETEYKPGPVFQVIWACAMKGFERAWERFAGVAFLHKAIRAHQNQNQRKPGSGFYTGPRHENI